MATELSIANDRTVYEQTTLVVTVTYTDENGGSVTPTAATWTLTDRDGTVINSRQDVTISTPGTSDDVVLQGDDLALQGTDDDGLRYFLCEFTYTSDAGAGLPGKNECWFNIYDLRGL